MEQEVLVVHVANIDEFIEKVMEIRKLPNEESLLLKIGVDDGQKLLKVCLSVIHLLGEMDPDKKVFEQQFKDSGVKKVFIIGITPGKETQPNLEKLLSLTGFQNTRHKIRIVTDIKAMNLILGIGCAASTHPCGFCHWRSDAGDEGEWDLRTFLSILDNYQRWMDSGGKKVELRKYFNCQNAPMKVYPDESSLVISVFCLPTLHLLQGVFNTIFQRIEAFFPAIALWPKMLKLKREEYHGRIFEVLDWLGNVNF